MQDDLKPKDHAEAVAIFRAQMIGPLVCRELTRGELQAQLEELSRLRVCPPGAKVTRHYSVPTLQRWYYAYRDGGLEGLRPIRRRDRGHGRRLTEPQRQLLLDIRREYPKASAELILRTLVLDGRLEEGAVSAPTVRRLYAEHALDRQSLSATPEGRARRRWVAEHPDALWHADVCHGPSLKVNDRSVPLRIHAIVDDHSRYVTGIQALNTEWEIDMLDLLVKATRRFGPPKTLYLDNGSTYRGDTLKTACARLGITLLHSRPRDPQARGKMERFFRTLRQGCLDHLGTHASLHDVQARLLAFVDRHYHLAAHAGLMGRAPAAVYEEGRAQREPDTLTDDQLRDALTVRGRRRVRKDGTLSVGGTEWELEPGFLAGRIVTVARTLIDRSPPWVEHEDKRFALRALDPRANAERRAKPRKRKRQAGLDVPFDPTGALLDKAAGRSPKGGVR